MNQETESGPDNQGIRDNQISDPDKTPDTGDTTTTLRCIECGKPFTRDTPEKAFRSVAAHALRSHSMKLNREDYGLGDKGEAPGGERVYSPEADDARDYRVRTKRERAVKDYYKASRAKENEIRNYLQTHPEILDELGIRRSDLYGRDRGRYDTFDEIGKLGAYERIGDYYDSKKRALENPPERYGARDPESAREIEELRRRVDVYEERERLRDVVESSIEKAIGPLKEELLNMKGQQTDTANRAISAAEDIAKLYIGVLGGRMVLESPPQRDRGHPGTVYDLIPEEYRERAPVLDQKGFTYMETKRRENV